MKNNTEKPTTNLSFLAAYHTARLSEFDYVHSSGVGIDTKSSVIIASNFVLFALLYTKDNLSCLANIALGASIASMLLGLWAIVVKNHAGPVADVRFEDDLRKGGEIKTMLQLIEDTVDAMKANLKSVKVKAQVWRWQAVLLLIAVTTICIDKVL